MSSVAELEAPKIPIDTVSPPSATFSPPVQPKKDVSMTSEPASDFNEDPFKNYRYEDPFMISDPFQDEETPADVFTGKKIFLFKFSSYFNKILFLN